MLTNGISKDAGFILIKIVKILKIMILAIGKI